MVLQAGATAPDFTLKSSKMEDVTLSKLRGKPVLLLFVPLAFTPTWTKEFGIVQSRLQEFKKLGEIFGISVDSPFSLAKWAEFEKFPDVPLLSDIGKEAASAYGVLNPDVRGMKGIAKRSAFLVDKQGKVVKSQLVEVAGDIPDLDGFLAEMKKLA